MEKLQNRNLYDFMIIMTGLLITSVKAETVNCQTVTSLVSPTDNLQSLYINEYTGLRGCSKQYCIIEPKHGLEILIFSDDSRGSDQMSLPVSTWKNKQMLIKFDGSTITLQPNSTWNRTFELSTDVSRSLRRGYRKGGFSANCTIEPIIIRTTVPPSAAALTTTHIALIVLAFVILIIVIALLVIYIILRKMKKNMRQRRNLNEQRYDAPDVQNDNNNRYNDGEGIPTKLGKGYRSLDMLNDNDHKKQTTSSPLPKLKLHVNPRSKPVSDDFDDDEFDEDGGVSPTNPVYINLSSPVHTLKPAPLTSISSLPGNRSDLDTQVTNPRAMQNCSGENMAAVYMDPEQECSTRAPLLTPTGTEADHNEVYDYAYADPLLLKNTSNDAVTNKLTNSKANPIVKPKPNVAAKSKTPLVLPNQNGRKVEKALVSNTKMPAVLPKPKTGSPALVQKLKSASPVMLPKPNISATSTNDSVPACANFGVKLKPTAMSKSNDKIDASPKNKIKSENVPTVPFGQALLSKPNAVPKHMAVSKTNSNPVKPIKHTNMPVTQTKSNPDSVKAKPNKTGLNNSPVTTSKLNTGQPKKALMPPKTPVKPRNALQAGGIFYRQCSEIDYEDV